MAYIATQAYWIIWPQVWLDEGMVVYDGELDPDDLAHLLDKGVLVSERDEIEPEPLPVEEIIPELAGDVTPDAPDAPDEAQPRRRRGHE